jgi:hypothetical protein
VAQRFSQFVKSQNPTGNTQVLCFLILFAEDVDPDKELRRYHSLDLEVKGLVKGAKGASSAPSVWHHELCLDAIFMTPPQFKVSATQGAHWWSERRCNNCHLLSSVDPVVLHQRANSRADCFIACFIGCFSDCFFAWDIVDCALHCPASQKQLRTKSQRRATEA